MGLDLLHPVVSRWFAGRFGEPTEAQQLCWPCIGEGGHVLLAAPTGSGKTLAAFLQCIDRLLRQGIDGKLPDQVQVVYVSPLKALSNDIRRNLETPLAEIGAAAIAAGYEPASIRALVRTGDTPASQRQAMLRKPPHILVTTPESLYLLLTGARSREMLCQVRTVIVDEIHALARDKRGSHLSLTLARLDHLCPIPPQRIGLSATQRPIDEIARFLVGTSARESGDGLGCTVIDAGHLRHIDLAVEVLPSELSAVCTVEQWNEVYARLCDMIGSHRSTLVFVNTRRMAERVCHFLEEQLGKGHVASHHGSLSREIRLEAEERLKAGELKAIVATASLELGIDIGYVDLVCQIGSPRSIATFLQRVGRSGHSLGKTPKGRLFALTRDELLEALAIIRAVHGGRLDAIEIPVAPLDILAQQIVAAVACEDWEEDALFSLCRRAWPYRDLSRADFDAVVTLVSEGVAPGNRAGALLHRDRIHGRLRARRGARIVAATSGGAIPETAEYRVITAGERTFVGTLNEDFAIESQSGDVFLLGNASWRIQHVRAGEVTVTDAQGAPATIPFWLGEGPGRTIELSAEFSTLREEISRRGNASVEECVQWLADECAADPWAARQAVEYVIAQSAATGVIPTQSRIVFERFFDESGGMQLVIHAPLGMRINRAWGLALRKSFCRTFDFELQASADDNGIVLSVGPNQSFPLEQMFHLARRPNAEAILVQALLAAPMFLVRWRWNVTRALAVLRHRHGKKVPPPLQRFRADDLLTAVFPMQTACFEHRTGDLEVPDHPLVRQTVHDCLHEAMDLPRWLSLLDGIEAGRIELVARDTREPSPFSYQLLNANPYAFLDDAPLEERRARAVAIRRTIRADDVRNLGRLDMEAIAQVRSEAWPVVRSAEELHDALLSLVALPTEEAAQWSPFFEELAAQGRAARCARPGGTALWAAAESWPMVRAAFPGATADPPLSLPPHLDSDVSAEEANLALVRGRLEISGPTSAPQIAHDLGIGLEAVQWSLEKLELDGSVLRGQFTGDASEVEWCQRTLLARIHRLTLDGLRRQVRPVDVPVFQQFLLRHQHVGGVGLSKGPAGLRQVIDQLQGFELPAGCWERNVFAARLPDYDPQWLDDLLRSGEVMWGRLCLPSRGGSPGRPGQILPRVVPIACMRRTDVGWLLPPDRGEVDDALLGEAQGVYEALDRHGALFFDDLLALTSLLPAQLEGALGQLAALGMVTADGFNPIRSSETKWRTSGRFTTRAARIGRARAYARGGRWSKFPPPLQSLDEDRRAERWAWQLLRRYGVMFRDLLTRESAAPPWHALRSVYRHLEARGEIRGGRFVDHVTGEQYALPSAVEALRKSREQAPLGAWHLLAAADPLNLVGIVFPGPRVPATRGNRVLFRDGQPVASRELGEIRWISALEEGMRNLATGLLRRPEGPHHRQSALPPTGSPEPRPGWDCMPTLVDTRKRT